MKSNRFERVPIEGTLACRHKDGTPYAIDFNTINLAKERKSWAIYWEGIRRISDSPNADPRNIPDDFRALAFDILNYLQDYRLSEMTNYRLFIRIVTSYLETANLQYEQGVMQRPCFLI